MSKIEKLNKVSKKKSEILKCDENALKFLFLLKKCVTITFFIIFGTKLSIQMYPLLGYNQKVPIIQFLECYHNSLEIFYKHFDKLCLLCSKSSKLRIFVRKGTNQVLRLNQNFKKSIGILKMDIFKMSKTENLNKVSKKKSEILKCDENALKFIFLLKKCVTITFYKVSRN